MSEYRVNFIPAIEASKESIKVESITLEQAKSNLDAMANLLLFLQDNGRMPDFSNAAWVERLVDGEWEEVDEEEG